MTESQCLRDSWHIICNYKIEPKTSVMEVVKYMKWYCSLDTMQKTTAMNHLSKNRPGKATVRQKSTYKALEKWCSVNQVVGQELCPPTKQHLASYLS